MDIPIQFNKNDQCSACLSRASDLQKLINEKMRQYYLDTIRELSELPSEFEPQLCNNCYTQLKDVVAFGEQIKQSYLTLLNTATEFFTPQTVHQYVIQTNGQIDAIKEIVTITEELTPTKSSVYLKDEIKDEVLEVEIDLPKKQPTDTLNLDLNVDLDQDLDHQDQYSTDEESKANDDLPLVVLKKRKKKKKINKNKLEKTHKKQNKIITIELTYEEMMLEREMESKKESYIHAPYKCENCILPFAYENSFKKHMASKHYHMAPGASPCEYACPVCRAAAASVDAFTAHYKRHMRRYVCAICYKRTSDVKSQHQHAHSAHGALKEYTCRICGKVSKSIDAHRYHVSSHGARVPCPHPACGKTFSHRAGLMNHTVAVHQKNNSFLCPVCGKVFRWKASVKRHLERHHNTTTSTRSAAFCATCDVSFQSVSSYQRHMKNSLKHVSQEDLRYICDECGRRFADKTKIRDHIEEKHLHRTFQCHICNKRSKNRVGLDQHVRNVHRGRPHTKMCHHCGKGFPTKAQLESHIRSHTGERPYGCKLCPTTFSQQSNLYKHNRQVHMNLKSKRNQKKAKEPTIIHPETPAPVAILQYTPVGFIM